MRGHASEAPELVRIGQRRGVSPEQVSLRWMLQRGVVAIPKSVHEDRIRANADVFGFELSAEEMAAIVALDRGQRLGAHPDRFLL
jgi:2,5-diketo-D-gluconate reductase A